MNKGIFIDDQDKSYAAMISTPGVLKFEPLPLDTLTKLASQVLAAAPLVVALDYRLDEEFAGVIPAADVFKGSALAQHLRDEVISQPAIDFGIVLVSAERKIQQVYAPDRTAHDLFDLVYSKEDIGNDRRTVQQEVAALGDAYRALRTIISGFKAGDILALGNEEATDLLSQELRFPIETAKAAHIAVRTVLKTVILQPGLLLDDHDASAILGIAPACFEKVVDRLQGASVRFSGLLSGGWRRWWAHRLEKWATEIFETQPTALSAAERAKRLKQRHAVDVEPALSPWNNRADELIAVACGCCRRPVEMRHTVAAFEPQLPRYASRRRICWDCVQKDNYEQAGLHIDESDLDLIDMIKNADRT